MTTVHSIRQIAATSSAFQSRKLQANRQQRCIAVNHCRWSQHELFTTTPEDAIMPGSRGAFPFAAYG